METKIIINARYIYRNNLNELFRQNCGYMTHNMSYT